MNKLYLNILVFGTLTYALAGEPPYNLQKIEAKAILCRSMPTLAKNQNERRVTKKIMVTNKVTTSHRRNAMIKNMNSTTNATTSLCNTTKRGRAMVKNVRGQYIMLTDMAKLQTIQDQINLLTKYLITISTQNLYINAIASNAFDQIHQHIDYIALSTEAIYNMHQQLSTLPKEHIVFLHNGNTINSTQIVTHLKQQCLGILD